MVQEKPLGWKLENFTANSLAAVGTLGYDNRQLSMEAEAFTFAETTSMLGAAKALAKECKVEP